MKAILDTGTLGVIVEDLHVSFIQFHFKRVVSKNSILFFEQTFYFLNLPLLLVLLQSCAPLYYMVPFLDIIT